MIRYLLDTDTISLLQRFTPEVEALLESFPTDEIGVSVISYEEQVTGRLAWIRAAKDNKAREDAYLLLAKTPIFFAEFPILNFTQGAMIRFGALRAQKLNVGPNDLRIASVALENNAAVVTRNVRDFSRVPGLRVETWV